MTRAIRLPALTLAVLLAFLLWNSVWTANCCACLITAVDSVSAAAAAGDAAAASRELAELEELWQQPQTYLHITVSHAELDTTETLLAQGKALCRQGDCRALYPLLAALRAQFRLIAETQELSLKNIL